MSVDVEKKKVDQFFEQYAPTPAPSSPPDYLPFEASSKRQKRIKLIRDDGSAVFVSYQFLIRFLLSSPDTLLTLIFSDVVITLEGQNLAQLADHLHDERIKTITCQNPKKHPAPIPDAVWVTAIHEQSPNDFRLEQE